MKGQRKYTVRATTAENSQASRPVNETPRRKRGWTRLRYCLRGKCPHSYQTPPKGTPQSSQGGTYWSTSGQRRAIHSPYRGAGVLLPRLNQAANFAMHRVLAKMPNPYDTKRRDHAQILGLAGEGVQCRWKKLSSWTFCSLPCP